jgi:hypothetical protein
LARNATRPKFTPKPLALGEPVVWVLKRAFGPPDRDVSLSAPEAAIEAADLLGYLPRIGQRTPRAWLEAELGAENATIVIHATHRVAASAAALNATARFVQVVAGEHGLPALFLKYSALAALGVVRPGSRLAGDVDVLASRHHGAALVRALIEHGARAFEHRRHEHELPALASPLDVSIDAHRYIPGVRLGRRDRFVDADDLIAAGLVDARTNTPAPEVLAAHALVHGFVENAAIPQSGAPARALADLVDLRHFAPRSIERALPLVERLFDARDVGDLGALALALERGNVDHGYDGQGAALLSHVLGTALDARYAASLRRFLLRAPLSERRGPGPLIERVAHMFVPTAAELSRIYGKPRGRLGLVGLRLWRPIDLAGRTLRLF